MASRRDGALLRKTSINSPPTASSSNPDTPCSLDYGTAATTAAPVISGRATNVQEPTTYTAPAGAAQSLSLVAFGDWGKDSPGLRNVTETFHREYPDLTAVLLLGDNFYGHGVSGVDDPQWELFRRMAAHRPSLPYYPVLGNHDHDGKAQAQVDYSRLDHQWVLPAFSHRHIFNSATTALCVHFVDTILWVKEGASAVEWLHQSLMADECQRAHWRIVVGHYPLHSAGKFKEESVAALRERLNPLMTAGRVSAYLCGHEHNMQHLRSIVSNVDIFLAGSVAQPRFGKGINPRHAALRWANEYVTGFLHLTATPAQLVVDFVQSGSAKVLHSVLYESAKAPSEHL